MADFCSVCAPVLFGPEIKPDIDTEMMEHDLEPGECYMPFICEGCGLAGLHHREGRVFGYYIDEGFLPYPEHSKKKIRED